MATLEVQIVAPPRAQRGTRSCARVWVVRGKTATILVRGWAGTFDIRVANPIENRGRIIGYSPGDVLRGPFDRLQAALDAASAMVSGTDKARGAAKSRVWLALELSGDADTNKQRAAQLTFLLHKLGVPDYVRVWVGERGYCLTTDASGSFLELVDNGHWFDLDALAAKEGA